MTARRSSCASPAVSRFVSAPGKISTGARFHPTRHATLFFAPHSMVEANGSAGHLVVKRGSVSKNRSGALVGLCLSTAVL